jgi:hypothetical protein
MKCVWGALLLILASCVVEPEVIYSEMPLDFFFDKWWALDDNIFFDGDTCFYLNSETNEILAHYPGSGPDTTYIQGDWTVENDLILLEDIYGYDISIQVYGACSDYNITISSGLMTEESNLYECDF